MLELKKEEVKELYEYASLTICWHPPAGKRDLS